MVDKKTQKRAMWLNNCEFSIKKKLNRVLMAQNVRKEIWR